MIVTFSDFASNVPHRYWGGECRKYGPFPNGFSMSVIRHSESYGNEDGLWEIAVIHPKGFYIHGWPNQNDCLLGRLTEEEVVRYLNETANFTAEDVERLRLLDWDTQTST